MMDDIEPTFNDQIRDCVLSTYIVWGVTGQESQYRDTLAYYLQQAGFTTTVEEPLFSPVAPGANTNCRDIGRMDIVVQREHNGVTEAVILELKCKTNPNTRSTLFDAKAQLQRYINNFRRFPFVCPGILIWFVPDRRPGFKTMLFPGEIRNTILAGGPV